MPLGKNNQIKDSLIIVNEKINEIKKKIQLSEGQRKAHFEECDAEKKKNIEKIRSLKKEVKEIYRKSSKPAFCEDLILKNDNRYHKEVGALRNKKIEDAIVFMDLKCIDLNKRLDVIKFRNKMRKAYFKKLAEEYRNIFIESNYKKYKQMNSVSAKPVCVLENRIHRVEMNIMEAEHVNKKYKTIRLHLLSESVEFESSLKKLEQEIRKQASEIKHLETVNKEALDLRDVTKGTLLRHELSAINAGKTRQNQLHNFRHRVEERKLELERLERRIFPSGRIMFDEGGESAQISQAIDGTSRQVSQLEACFVKLKLATGETETESVFPRFLSQKETKQRLDFLKKITEEEKKQLELRKEVSLAELEAFKFSEVKDKEGNQEELEKINGEIEFQKRAKERHQKEIKRILDVLFNVKKQLILLVPELQVMNDESPSETSEDVNACCNLLSFLTRKIQSGFQKVGYADNFEDTLKCLESSQYHNLKSDTLKLVSGEEIPLFGGLLQHEVKSSKPQQPSLLVPETEDEDVLTRIYLKRQAQLIVDSKSRKKFSRVLNFSKIKK